MLNPLLANAFRPPAGEFFVVYAHGEPIGCGAVKHHSDAPAEIKRMWIAPKARDGRGSRVQSEDVGVLAHKPPPDLGFASATLP